MTLWGLEEQGDGSDSSSEVKFFPKTQTRVLLAFWLEKPYGKSDTRLKKTKFDSFFRSNELMRFDTRWQIS